MYRAGDAKETVFNVMSSSLSFRIQLQPSQARNRIKLAQGRLAYACERAELALPASFWVALNCWIVLVTLFHLPSSNKPQPLLRRLLDNISEL